MPHLIAFRDWCRYMADRDDTTLPDRALWTQLADEIDAYLNPGTDPDEGLF